VAVSADSSGAVVQLAEQFGLCGAVGIHPNSTADAAPADWDRVTALIDHPRVVALGETGLDRYWDFAPMSLQQDYLDRHLRLSQQCGLPVILHCRDAAADLMPMLHAAAARGPLSGVLHAFSGDADWAA
jgi:TatD DNase family protein